MSDGTIEQKIIEAVTTKAQANFIKVLQTLKSDDISVAYVWDDDEDPPILLEIGGEEDHTFSIAGSLAKIYCKAAGIEDGLTIQNVRDRVHALAAEDLKLIQY